MVLGEKERSDVDFEESAVLKVESEKFMGQNVYGDRKMPDRRTVIPGSDVDDAFPGDYPARGRVKWQGKTYPARISFRYSDDGVSVPVYEFFLDAETVSQLRKK